MRPLDDDEQKRLSAQYPKWSAVIQDSGPATYCIEVEGQAIREETGSFWRRPRFLKGLGIACAVGLSGAVIAGAVFHLYRARADSLTPPELPSILDPLSVSTYTPSERPMPSSTPSEGQMPSSTPSDGQMPSSTPSEGQMPSSTPSQGQMPSSTPSEGPMPSFTTSRGLIYSETRSEAPMTTYTPITEATTHNYTSWYDAQFSRLSDVERYKYAVSCDCEAWSESDLVVNCKPVAIESRAGNIAMSAHELALLRIPSDTCKGIYDNNKNASMVDATADAWKTLDWSGCDLGGKVVCVDDRGEDLSCHYFNHPFKHDFPRVWEAVIRHLKPARCLLTNNADLDVRYIRNLARGRAAAKYITADIGGISDESLNALGLTLDWYYGTAACSGTYNDCQLPDCGCVEGRFSAEAVDPSGKDVVWGYVTDFFTTAEEMKGNYSLFQTPGYSPKFCKFECFNPDPETLEGYGNRVAEEYRINIGDRQARKHNCWSNVTA
ncbi:putative transmembrane protein [Gregarina niphandrodes]|uniref:Transmembrane protein n=1 Tax=Gregarina niphandrodes TaxID=110365 RepID=A0A023AYA3_GRENI|nr:putative transmembrane protein [Gregarina niphandrodes]EZG43639.1 putative transmembrane protein [Gregarina niphandrodes]|eukprot:XP_011133131.1 putative transmembrane protein [Gregarina niphandrodes]